MPFFFRSLLLACAGCACALLLAGCSPAATELFHNLDDVEANRLVAALESQGVHATKSAGREGIAILVPRAELARAALLSAQGGLPRGEHPSFGVLFRKDGLISSPLEERARMMYALSQQLEVMLMDIEGVVSARVNVVLPEARPGRSIEQPSAAVLIRHATSVDADLLQWTVRQLVVNSVPGLAGTDGQRVSVAFTAASGADTVPRDLSGAPPTCGGIAAAAGRVCATAATGGWTASTLIAVAAIVTIFAGIGSLAWSHPSMAGVRRRLKLATIR